jgi:hypothetical protein
MDPLAPPTAHEPDAGQELFCPACDYNLHGLTGERCPECGRDVAAILGGEVAIPWLERREMGRLRAYWRTVALLTFKPRKFNLAKARPGSERDARRFRAMTVLHVLAALLVLDAIFFLFFPKVSDRLMGFLGAWYIAASQVGLATGIVAITSAPYYAIDHRDTPPELSLRAALLGFYACAPLAWTFVLVLPLVLGALAEPYLLPKYSATLYALALPAAMLLFSAPDFHVFRLIKALSDAMRVRRRIQLKFMLLWLAALLIAFAIPNVVLYFVVVVRSLS